ncbi:MAG: transcription antitermination factor NusB [Anaerolineae bacterium]|nr:transcription antitermination factor NusB [Anaerolineae bacterium]
MTDLPEFNENEENEDGIEIIATEVLKHPEALTEHTAARRIALQVLYEMDSAPHQVGDVLTSRFQEAPVNRKTERYVRQVVLGVLENREKLDVLIQRYADEFPLPQIAIIDRNILRIGVYEFAAEANIPVNVIISEAIELANLFGADGSTRFINGVLGALATDGREQMQQIITPPDNNGEE